MDAVELEPHNDTDDTAPNGAADLEHRSTIDQRGGWHGEE